MHSIHQVTEIVSFWEAAGPQRWFRKDSAFDEALHVRFLPAHEDAARGECADWASDATGSLALLILLDQFPRNAFRQTPRMYATDAMARAVADPAIAAGHDRAVPPALRQFFYLPFMHSEALDDQQRSLALYAALAAESAGDVRGTGGTGESDEASHREATRHAREHHEIVVRFGRFPHRNAVLGRSSTAAELAFLEDGGFAG